MLDSGAGASLATKGALDNAGMQLRPADKTLVDASGNNIRLLGMIIVVYLPMIMSRFAIPLSKIKHTFSTPT